MCPSFSWYVVLTTPAGTTAVSNSLDSRRAAYITYGIVAETFLFGRASVPPTFTFCLSIGHISVSAVALSVIFFYRYKQVLKLLCERCSTCRLSKTLTITSNSRARWILRCALFQSYTLHVYVKTDVLEARGNLFKNDSPWLRRTP